MAALYLMAAFAPFLSPHDPNEKSLAYREAPPQRLHFFSDQGLHLRPFVYPFTAVTNRESFKRDYLEDRQQRYPLRFFVRGYRYQLLFLFESDIHLFGTGVEEVPVHLIGTDHLGRDMLARVMYGAQISLSVGLVGVAISFLFGHSDRRAGALAGYFGGWVDEAVQRVVEVLLSIPQLPLWMGLSAARCRCRGRWSGCTILTISVAPIDPLAAALSSVLASWPAPNARPDPIADATSASPNNLIARIAPS